jgi:methionyl-tRNA formyltransferase
LHVVQPSGKKEMTAADFLRGHRLQPGHRFVMPQTESLQ